MILSSKTVEAMDAAEYFIRQGCSILANHYTNVAKIYVEMDLSQYRLRMGL